jgi:drug/metabolite transporter (DMT)-like permease
LVSSKKCDDLTSALLGESAAVLTSCLWTGSSLLFTSAGRRIGAFSVNAYRTTIAILLLVAAHIVLLGSLLPLANGGQWFWMGLSGVVGLGIGDFGLFAAYVTIGPRRSLVIQASSPIFACIGAYALLSQPTPLLALFGITITLTGIVLVLVESGATLEEKLRTNRRRKWGLLFGLVSAMGQGFGVDLSKKGLYFGVSTAMNPVSAALIRMLFAGVFVWAFVAIAGRLPEAWKTARDRVGMKYATAGAVIGPFLGMTLSMVAVANADPGVAQTLMSLSPVFIIPLVWAVYREETNVRGIIGAIVAVVGVAVLFLA